MKVYQESPLQKPMADVHSCNPNFLHSAAQPRSVVQAATNTQAPSLKAIQNSLKAVLDLRKNEAGSEWNKHKLEELARYTVSHPTLVSKAYLVQAMDDLSRLKSHNDNETPMNRNEKARVEERLKNLKETKPVIHEEAEKLVSKTQTEAEAEQRNVKRG